MNNGSSNCVSAAAWVSESNDSDYRRIISLLSSNNIAEIVAAALALHSWPSTNLHIHTDSKLVL